MKNIMSSSSTVDVGHRNSNCIPFLPYGSMCCVIVLCHSLIICHIAYFSSKLTRHSFPPFSLSLFPAVVVHFCCCGRSRDIATWMFNSTNKLINEIENCQSVERNGGRVRCATCVSPTPTHFRFRFNVRCNYVALFGNWSAEPTWHGNGSTTNPKRIFFSFSFVFYRLRLPLLPGHSAQVFRGASSHLFSFPFRLR